MPLSMSKGAALASLGLFGLVLVGAVSFFVVRKTVWVDPGMSQDATATEPLQRHPLTGVPAIDPVRSPSLLPRVFAVMVENSYDAWPLSGLDQAFLVIEAPVEGGIPRFEAFFEEGVSVEKIGPVRSARPYYIDWAQEFDALYAHVGGSPEALALIEERDVLDLNQFFYGEDFWRSKDRFAPHNVYTSSDLLSDAREDILSDHAEIPTYAVWLFKDDAPVADPQDIAIDFASGSSYDMEWRYQIDTHTYLRVENGSSTSMTASPIFTNNVIVLATDVKSIDEKDRKSVRTIGEGEALVAQDGALIEARWKKISPTDRLRFYTKEGAEIAMNAGKTWIEIVNDITKVTASMEK